MSLAPREIPLGAMRFNSDSQKLEYWMGSAWMQIQTFSPNLDGGARGIAYRAGANNDIEFITIPTQGNATDFGSSTVSAGGLHTAASNTRSIAAGGGTPGRINVIEFVTFSSTGNAQNFGDLTQVGAGGGQMGMSNQTRGVFLGGNDPFVNTIDFVLIASTGDATHFGDVSIGVSGLGAAGSNCHGGLS